MSRRNYDQMYNKGFEEKKEQAIEPVVEQKVESEEKEEKVEPVADTVREEVKEEKAKGPYKGKVIGGRRLNVRQNPNGNIVDSLADGEIVTIVDDSDQEWYKIKSPEGFVKKEFIQV